MVKQFVSQNPALDAQIESIVDFLFGFKEPPAGLELPVVPWDLFTIDRNVVPEPNWRGVCRGEGLVGLHPDPKTFIWQEVGHLDSYIGDEEGPAGVGHVGALDRQAYGFNNLGLIVNPNLSVKPGLVLVTKCETNSRERANQMHGTVQSAIADATVDAVEHGFYPESQLTRLVGTIIVFIDPLAGAVFEGGKAKRDDRGRLVMLEGDEAEASNHRLYCFNYFSMLAAHFMMATGGRSIRSMIDAKAKAPHVLRGFKPASVKEAEQRAAEAAQLAPVTLTGASGSADYDSTAGAAGADSDSDVRLTSEVVAETLHEGNQPPKT